MYNEPQRTLDNYVDMVKNKNNMNLKSDSLDATNDSCNIGSWTTSK